MSTSPRPTAPAQLSLDGFATPAAPTDRLFFALLPDAAAAARISEVSATLRQQLGLTGRPIEPARLHVTLHHVGDHPGLPGEVVEQARRAGAAAAAAAAPFDLAFDRAESFAGRPHNRPFVLRGEGLQALVAFQQALGRAMAVQGLGRWVEARFTPHVTLAYDDTLVPAQPLAPIGWRATECVLMHSLLGQHRHVPLGRWTLG